MRTHPRLLALLCAFIVLCVAGVSLAQAADLLPETVQAALFRKIFSYNEALAGRNQYKVVILSDQADEARLRRSFGETGVDAVVAKSGAGVDPSNMAAVYLFPSNAAAFKEFCEKEKVLSISGYGELAVSGQVSVALGKKADGRPEIIVNLSRATAEGQKFSADFLGYARVIR